MKSWTILLQLLFWCLLPCTSGTPAPAQGRRPATLTAVRNATVVQRSLQGAAVTPVVRGLPLENGYVVRTNPAGMAETLFRDGRHVKLAQSTTLEISPTRADRMRVLSGKVWVRVPPRTGLQIDGLAANCHVTGTELQLEVAEDGTTTLTVVEGEVRFENPQGQVVVREAQQSRARQGQAPTPPIVAANLPVLLEWTNELQPVALLLEVSYVSQDPERLQAALREAEAMVAGPARWQRLGDVQHDRGELTAALEAYQQALAGLGEAAPAGERAGLLARVGQTWLELGKVPEAEQSFRQSLALDPAATAARAGLVMAMLTQRQNDAALSTAREAVQRDERSPVAHTVLALTLIRQGQRDEAQQALEQALRLDPQYAQALAWRSFLLRAAERLEEAEQAAVAAVKAAPHSSLAQQALADALFALGRNREARRAAERAVALNPLSPGAHVSLGRALLQEGNIDGALREATKAVALDPNLERARYFRGVALAQRRNLGEAARELERAIQMDPGYLEARTFLARVYLAQGRRSEAVAVVQEAMQRNPQFAPARAALGRVYWRSGRLKEAAAEYRQALELSPGNVLYLLESARVYLDQNNLPDALANAQAAVARAPGSSEAHAVLGLVYDRQDNQEQAIREYREAISLSPENSLARLGLVTAFAPRVRFSGGRERLRERAQALLRDPSVLQEVFEPGVTSEVFGGVGEDSTEEQRFLHRGQFARGRINDLTIASRYSDDGGRDHSSLSGRQFQSDIAIQATPDTQLLAQLNSQKDSGGLPESTVAPDANAYRSRRENEFNLWARQYLGRGAHLWLKYGLRSPRTIRDDPDAVAQPIAPGIPDLSLYQIYGRADEREASLRLDYRVGRHLLTYGLADLHLNAQPQVLSYALPDETGRAGANRSADVQVQVSTFIRDRVQFLQDNFTIGERGSWIIGTHLLRRREQNIQQLRAPLFAPPGEPPVEQELFNQRTRGRDLLPYTAFTYQLDSRNLIRLIGNKTRLRPSDAQLQPSEAFIIGEPISTYFSVGFNAPVLQTNSSAATQGGTETYELDFERRFSRRTFSKLFLQYSLARDYAILPSQDQQFIPQGFTFPKAVLRIAGVRLEHQIHRYLSGFTRWSYWDVEDRTDTAHGVGADPANPVPNPSRRLQLPMEPRWRALTGLNYVDRSGTKALLVATYIGQRYADLTFDRPGFASPTFDRDARRPSTGPHVLFDLRLAKEPSIAHEYGLTIINLFNTSFQDVWADFPTRGRTWVLTYARRF